MQPFWIEAPTRNLAIIPRPRGWDWLGDDLASLKRVGIDAIVSTLTTAECEELGLIEEASLCERNGIDYLSFPIEDRSVPPSRSEFERFLQQVEMKLSRGLSVGVHCRACIGRSAILVAGLLVRKGMTADDAFATIGRARGCAVPDTREQREWVENLVESHDRSTLERGARNRE